MKTVCASEMAAILKIIENWFRPKCPRIISMGFLSTQKLFKILIYIKIPSINGDITKIWNRNFYGGHLVLCKLGVFGPGCLMGTSRFWKRRFSTVILIPLWLCPGGGGGGGCTWDPGGPPTIWAYRRSYKTIIGSYIYIIIKMYCTYIKGEIIIHE